MFLKKACPLVSVSEEAFNSTVAYAKKNEIVIFLSKKTMFRGEMETGKHCEIV